MCGLTLCLMIITPRNRSAKSSQSRLDPDPAHTNAISPSPPLPFLPSNQPVTILCPGDPSLPLPVRPDVFGGDDFGLAFASRFLPVGPASHSELETAGKPPSSVTCGGVFSLLARGLDDDTLAYGPAEMFCIVLSSKTATVRGTVDLRRTSTGRLVLVILDLYLARRSKAALCLQ